MKKISNVIVWMLVAALAAFPAGGCNKSEGGEDTRVDAVEDPQPEELVVEEEQVEEEALEEVAPELPLDLPSEVPEGPENCPPPPYGTQAGDIIQPHEFISVDDTLLSLCDFYQDTSVKLLLIYATAGWCTYCGVESQALPGIYSTYHPQGLEIMAAVFQDNSGNPATRSFAANYARTYAFPFPTVVDNTFQLGIYFDAASTPMNMYVDLTTMEILEIGLGYDSQMGNTIAVYLSQITR